MDIKFQFKFSSTFTTYKIFSLSNGYVYV